MSDKVKIASMVVALIVSISAGLYAFDSTYVRYCYFEQHQQKHLKQDIFDNQKMIWEYKDRIKKNPHDEDAQQRLRELEFHNDYLRDELKKGGK